MLSMWCKRASGVILLEDATTNQPEGPNCFVQVVASLDLSIDLVLVKGMVIHDQTHSLLWSLNRLFVRLLITVLTLLSMFISTVKQLAFTYHEPMP